VSKRPYNRVLVKISGNCFSDPELLEQIAGQISRARGTKLAVVMGGGNILRGKTGTVPRRARRPRSVGPSPFSPGLTFVDRVAADQAGMLATVVNGIRLAELLATGSPVSHFSAVGIPGTVPGYDVWQAREALERGRILVLSGGTGNPFFSTDSAAALRAAELGMDAILKGTRVAGVYSADPEKSRKARFYHRLTFEQALRERLEVMDLTAFALCMEQRIPIVVFDISRPGAILDIIKGKRIGSLVC
jgi:uridylate kinase